MLSWTGRTEYRGPVRIFVIGQLATYGLSQPSSDLGNGAIYYLNLVLDKDTAKAIQAIFDDSPVEGEDFIIHSPLHTHRRSSGGTVSR